MKWRDFDIEVTCKRDYPIEGWCHIEVRCDEPIPITETGYKSHHTAMERIDSYEGGAEEFVTRWLELKAYSKEWEQYERDRKQLSLF